MTVDLRLPAARADLLARLHQDRSARSSTTANLQRSSLRSRLVPWKCSRHSSPFHSPNRSIRPCLHRATSAAVFQASRLGMAGFEFTNASTVLSRITSHHDCGLGASAQGAPDGDLLRIDLN